MQGSLFRRRRLDLVLDAIFFVWLGFVVISGQVFPSAVVGIFRHEAPAVVRESPPSPMTPGYVDIVADPET